VTPAGQKLLDVSAQKIFATMPRIKYGALAPKVEAKPIPKTEVKPEVKTEAKPVPAEAKPAPKAKPQPKAEVKSQTKVEAKPEAKEK